jgi:hypothetical protein
MLHDLRYFHHSYKQERNRKISDFFCCVVILGLIIAVATCAIDLLFKLL